MPFISLRGFLRRATHGTQAGPICVTLSRACWLLAAHLSTCLRTCCLPGVWLCFPIWYDLPHSEFLPVYQCSVALKGAMDGHETSDGQ